LARGRVNKGDKLFDSIVYKKGGIEIEEVRCGLCGHLLFVYAFDGATESEQLICYEPCKHFKVVSREKVRSEAKQLTTIMDRTKFWGRVRCCGDKCYKRK